MEAASSVPDLGLESLFESGRFFTAVLFLFVDHSSRSEVSLSAVFSSLKRDRSWWGVGVWGGFGGVWGGLGGFGGVGGGWGGLGGVGVGLVGLAGWGWWGGGLLGGWGWGVVGGGGVQR